MTVVYAHTTTSDGFMTRTRRMLMFGTAPSNPYADGVIWMETSIMPFIMIPDEKKAIWCGRCGIDGSSDIHEGPFECNGRELSNKGVSVDLVHATMLLRCKPLFWNAMLLGKHNLYKDVYAEILSDYSGRGTSAVYKAGPAYRVSL